MKQFNHKDYLVILDYNHNGCLATAIGDNDYFKIQYQGYTDRQIKGRVKHQIDYRIENGFFSDVMNASFREVNFHEIARHYVEAEAETIANFIGQDEEA